MPDLSVEEFGIAVVPFTNYLPLSEFPADSLPMDRLLTESRGIPLEHLLVASTDDTVDTTGEPDARAMVLAALGVPEREQPLILVSGPPRDSMVSALAGLVYEFDWPGEDVGITHLEELGGTLSFGLLDWAVPEEAGATVLISDEPLVADARVGRSQLAAVGLRVSRGPGPLRVLGFGEGAPDEAARAAEHRFSGSGPCDSWLAFHDALAAGRIGDGDRVALHVSAPLRQGWLLLHAVDTAGLRLVDGASRVGS